MSEKPCCGKSTVAKIAHGSTGLLKAGLRAVGIPVDAATAEEAARRLAVCESCEHATEPPPRIPRVCRLCSCVLSLKAATASETCPADPPKW